MAVRHGVDDAFAHLAPAVQTRHVRPGAALVDEHQLLRRHVGQRCVPRIPLLFYVGTVLLGGPLAAVTVDAAVDADAFVTWAREVLAPCLSPGDVVVMDNLPAHKVPGVAEAIGAAGAGVRYLPPYSPDYNPIENMWSKVKAHLRAAAARTFDALGEAIGQAMASVTPADCRGFFAHCGYPAT